ncbi:MAG: hypothetical protein ACTSW0_09365 [Candidatus Heimdallarchaeota archaeon]
MEKNTQEQIRAKIFSLKQFYLLVVVFLVLIVLILFAPIIVMNSKNAFRVGGILFFEDNINFLSVKKHLAKQLAFLLGFGLLLEIVGFNRATSVKSSVIPPMELQAKRRKRKRIGSLLQLFGGLLSLVASLLHIILLRSFRIIYLKSHFTAAFYLIVALTVIVIINAIYTGLYWDRSIITNEIIIKEQAAKKGHKVRLQKKAVKKTFTTILFYAKATLHLMVLCSFFLALSAIFLTYSKSEKPFSESLFLKFLLPPFFTLFGTLIFSGLNVQIKTSLRKLQNGRQRTSGSVFFFEKMSFKTLEVLYKNTGQIFFATLVGGFLFIFSLALLVMISFFGFPLPDWPFYHGGVTYRDAQTFWNVFYWTGIIFLAIVRIILFLISLGLIAFGITFTGYISGLICKERIRGLLSGILLGVIIFIFYFLCTQDVRVNEFSEPRQYAIFIICCLEIIASPISGYFGGKRFETNKKSFRRNIKIEITNDFDDFLNYRIKLERRKKEFIKDKSKNIIQKKVNTIEKLIFPLQNVNIDWLKTVTGFEEELIISILSEIYQWEIIERKAFSDAYWKTYYELMN